MNGHVAKFLRRKARQEITKKRGEIMIEMFKFIIKMSWHERLGIAWRIIWKIG